MNPSARVTIGKRISDRIYLTYARSLSSSTRDEIILLEFDQSDTLGLGALAERGPHLRARSAQEAHVLMRLWVFLAMALVTAAAAAQAQSAEPLIGQLVIDQVVVTTEGTSVGPGVLELVETRIGEPLSLEAVRGTIDHLIGLGRYDDVRALATRMADGVALRWVLRPIRLVTRVTVSGRGDLPADAVRAVIDERFGGEMAASEAPALAAAVTTFYRDHGYRAAAVSPLLEPDSAPGTATLTLQVEPGPRTTIASASVTGTPTEPAPASSSACRFSPAASTTAWRCWSGCSPTKATCAPRGSTRPPCARRRRSADEAHTADVEVTVEAGLRVRLVYAGDPIPGGIAGVTGAGAGRAIGRRRPARGCEPQHRGVPAASVATARLRRRTRAPSGTASSCSRSRCRAGRCIT